MTASLINKIQQLAPEERVVLQEFTGEFGKLTVGQHGQYRWLQMADANIQSLVDTTMPSRVMSPTTVLMLLGLAFTKGRKRLLNLGLGGGAVERCLRSCVPSLQVETVELDSHIVTLAREFFYLPEDHVVHVQDAQDFVKISKSKYDLILSDMFFESVPPDFVKHSEFFADLSRCLGTGGVCVMNLLYDEQAVLVRTLQAARKHLPATWLIEVEGHQNVIAFFMRERCESDEELQKECERVLSKLNVEPLSFCPQLVAIPDAGSA